MKNIFLGIISALLLLVACKPIDERDSMGAPLDPSAIKISAKGITAGSNKIILSNETVGASGVWDYLIGTSFRKVDTVILPFKGVITIPFTAVTAGGLVQASTTVQIDRIEPGSVEAEWTYLAGTDAKGKTWDWDFGNPEDMAYDGSAGVAYGNGSEFAKSPEWWKASQGDVRADGFINNSMTFDLNGKATVTVTDEKGVSTSGKFILNLKANDASKGIIGTLDFINLLPMARKLDGLEKFTTPYKFEIVKINENQLFLRNRGSSGGWCIMYCLKKKGYVYPSK